VGFLPLPIEVSFDLYYAAIFGNLTAFGVGFAAALAIPRRRPLADALTLIRDRSETSH